MLKNRCVRYDDTIYIYITGPLMSVLLFKPYRLRGRLT